MVTDETRTIAVGDIHGDLRALETLMGRLPVLRPDETLVFLGDYVDRGPCSAQVVAFLREQLPRLTPARIVLLRGNHEDAWLRVVREGWPEFVMPAGNGCRECVRSFLGYSGQPTETDSMRAEFGALFSGSFLPRDVVEWMGSLPFWYEDEHAIYLHAGIPLVDGRYPHPSEVVEAKALLWTRELAFYRDYRGKRIVCGHTITSCLPQQLSVHTPDDATDLWEGPHVTAIDTGAGKDGFLTAVELPRLAVYESHDH